MTIDEMKEEIESTDIRFDYGSNYYNWDPSRSRRRHVHTPRDWDDPDYTLPCTIVPPPIPKREAAHWGAVD